MSASYKILPTDLFVRTVKHNFDVEHVFLLGAGASKSSGVLTAEECIWEWKKEIFKSNNIDKLDEYRDLEWNADNAKKIIQDWLDNVGSYPTDKDPSEYSFYAEKSFVNSRTRRKFFEGLFQDKKPGVGYKLLCLLAESGMAKIIFTTNFDGLFVKAANQADDIKPKEITIETADLIHQPITGKCILCVALHGDYKYAKLKNTETELDNQSDDFKTALKFHLYNKHLIVLGYSGRDKSLMSALENAYSAKGSGELFWCNYKGEVSQDVENLLNNVNRNERKVIFPRFHGHSI
ncbi:MAG: SIR2 family protein [Thermodesulfovibrionales bacterium]|nr:SIR2 family protein [Thermodesulfovibrionales bacterium]